MLSTRETSRDHLSGGEHPPVESEILRTSGCAGDYFTASKAGCPLRQIEIFVNKAG